MTAALITGGRQGAIAGLIPLLKAKGFVCQEISGAAVVLRRAGAQTLALVDLGAESDEILQQMKGDRVPVIALAESAVLACLDLALISDFIVKPVDVMELELRMKRLLGRSSGETITCSGLVIDAAKCEVTLDGNAVMLTFKEYELLRFLASKRGRVFSRQALLDEVWGYDYYGGDRTVDVHVRRLRSKIEDAHHTFIETVRNIGYRFRDGVQQ